MADEWIEDVRSLLDGPSPAVLMTYRKDGSANVSPVWFRWHDGAIEVVIAHGDVKLKHLARDPRCALVVFEAVPPFRGLEVRGVPELVEGDVTQARVEIAGRYLGTERRPALRSRTHIEAGSPTSALGGGPARLGSRRDPADVVLGLYRVPEYSGMSLDRRPWRRLGPVCKAAEASVGGRRYGSRLLGR